MASSVVVAVRVAHGVVGHEGGALLCFGVLEDRLDSFKSGFGHRLRSKCCFVGESEVLAVRADVSSVRAAVYSKAALTVDRSLSPRPLRLTRMISSG